MTVLTAASLPSTPASDVVLVVTHGEDDHTAPVLQELARLDVNVVRFDTESYPERASVCLETVAGRLEARFLLPGAQFCARDVGAVWYRHRRLPVAAHVPAGPAREMAEAELLATLDGALLNLDAYWLNHPHDNQRARHKLLQLRLALRAGFTVPETRVTADPQEVRALYRAWGGRMVAKLVGGQAPVGRGQEQYVVYTSLLSEEDLRSDAALAACPALYQRYVDKAYELRVTVVGDQVFAVRIDSQGSDGGSIDWRQAKRTSVHYEVHALEPQLALRCRGVVSELGLDFAGLDLIVTPQGETVFLEVNAAGQWAWLQEATGVPIAAAIAERLAAGAREHRGHSGHGP